MRAFTRGPTPDVLEDVADNVASFVRRRKSDPTVAFAWPQRDGASILPRVRAALSELTDEHCSYCDGYPVDAQGQPEVDHFQPKSRFPELVLSWTNLYFACSGCNGLNAKAEQWNEHLIRPDDPSYSFERYFIVDFLTGELQPNPAAHPSEQTRAMETIRILNLQRPGLCVVRRKEIKEADNDPLRPYRFLKPLTARTSR